MSEYHFTVVYRAQAVESTVYEARFSGANRNDTNVEAAQFVGLLEARGLEFRVWNPEGQIVNQSMGFGGMDAVLRALS